MTVPTLHLFARRRPARVALAAAGTIAIAALLMLGGRVRSARASDHQDNPLVELNPAMDMTDVYAFPGAAAGRVTLVMDTWAFLTPGQTSSASFDPNLLYQFKIDNTGDAKEDRVLQVVFKGKAPNQTVEVRGPLAPPVVGAMMNRLADADPIVSGPVGQILGSADGVQVFAGPREDPFFIDLEQFFRILPDRKPSTGQLGQLPDTATAGSFRAPGAAVDFVKGFNVMSIVIELPASQLTAGGNAKIGLWGTISR